MDNIYDYLEDSDEFDDWQSRQANICLNCSAEIEPVYGPMPLYCDTCFKYFKQNQQRGRGLLRQLPYEHDINY